MSDTPSTTVVSRIEYQYAVTGLDTTTSALNRVADAEARLVNQSKGLAGASADLDRSTLSAQRALDGFARGLDPASKYLAQYERGLRLANNALAQGVPLTDVHTRSLAAAKARWEDATRGANDNAKALHAHGDATKLSTVQIAEFGHIGRAALDELGAGMSPLQVIRTEGARLVQTFSEGPGGVAGTFKALGSGILGAAETALGFVNPMVLAGAAVVGFGVAALTAAAHARALREEMDQALSGVGRAAGLSPDGLNDIATASAARTGIGLGDSRANAEALASTGKLNGSNISSLLDLTRGYASAFGTTYTDAGKALADIFKDPVKGADALNERLGFLDDRTRQYIRTLQAQGDQQGAVKALIDASAASMNEQAKPQGFFGRANDAIARQDADIAAELSSFGSGTSPLDRYRTGIASDPSNSIFHFQAGVLRGGGATGAGYTQADVDNYSDAEDLRRAGQLRRMQQDDVTASARSQSAGDIIRSTLPDVGAQQKLLEQRNNLQSALNETGVVAKLGPSAAQAFDALDRLNEALATFQTSVERVALQSALTIAGIEARTFAEKQAVEYQKNYTETLARTHSVLEATTTAEARRNEAIAGATRQAVDNALPGLAQQTRMSDDIGLLRDALNKPGASSDLRQAYGNDAVKQGFASPALRQQQDYDLAIASADAFSVAERSAIAARRAELEVLRETGDLTRAQAAAQMAVNEAIAKANSDAEDRANKAQEDRELVGLSPYERGLQQIKNRYEGVGGLFAKDAGDNADYRSNLSDSMRPVASDLRTAGQLVVEALHQVAGGIAGTTPGGAPSLPTFARIGATGTATPSMIADAASRTGMPANVIAAIGQIENGERLSGGTTLLGSNGKPSSAWGFGQLTDGAAADVARAVPGFSKYDPSTAVFGSAEYLKILAGRHNGDMTAALNAYGGTSDYAGRIMRLSGGIDPSKLTSTGPAAPAPIASTGLASDRSAMNDNVGAFNQEQLEGPLKTANQALQNQVSLFDAQKTSAGQSAAAIQAAAKAQELLNQYTNLDPNHKMGAAAWDQITTGVAHYKEQLQATLEQQQAFQKQQQQIVSTMDGFRGGFGDGIKSFVSDLEHGKSAGSAFRDVMEQIGQKLQGAGLDALTGSLFGKSGTSGGGLLGGGLGSLFGGLGSLFGLGKSSAASSGYQGWWGGSAFAAGGVMTSSGPLPLRRYAGGGVANTPQLAVYGEGAHTEAYVPLPDGRSIPVAMKGSPRTSAAPQAAPNVTVGGHQIIIQGNADEKTAAMVDQKIQAANAQQYQRITRDLQSINSTNQQYT